MFGAVKVKGVCVIFVVCIVNSLYVAELWIQWYLSFSIETNKLTQVKRDIKQCVSQSHQHVVIVRSITYAYVCCRNGPRSIGQRVYTNK